MMRAPIRVMPTELALKIAAGEVVERPASVVKELVDNAVDAGARAVKIDLREAGLKMIRVTDNGHGMPRAELPLAFTSHATSKIASLDDLERLTTLGFRGEALPSIAAVSRVEVQSHVAGEAAGARFVVEYGRVVAEGICATPVGTRITVSDLFGNVPARRKFVRSLRAEGSQIAAVVLQYALAQPAIQFDLTIDGRPSVQSPGTGRLDDALAAGFGADLLASLHPVDGAEAGIQVRGLISGPELSRQNRSAIHLFVNGRPVANRSLVFALEEAYSGFLMVGRHPVAALHLTVPPGEVDVNIHPAKSEVRFAHDRDVHGALHRAAANSLLALRLASRQLSSALEPSLAAATAASSPPLLPDEPEPVTPPLLSGLPTLRVFGQANATFIIAEGPNGLYMIDQHAAHERILFDRLEEQVRSGIAPSQPLLQPLALDLAPAQMLALEENRALLRQVGFELEPFGDSACLVRAVPALARSGEPAELVGEVLEELQKAPEPSAARERTLASVACKAAIKAGQVLDVQEMRELVAQMERTPRPNTCPHGRPTMIHLSNSQLEREFGRI